jgi:hypothetical protein
MERSGYAMLFTLADSYILEACSGLNVELFSELRKIIQHYISGVITCERASELFIETVGVNTPVHRISAILRVSEHPAAPSMPLLPTPVLPLRARGKAWTKYEDERLLSAIMRFGVDNWATVAQFVGTQRTKSQCAQRWFRSLNPSISRVMWTREEEARLSELVQRHGLHSWMRVAAELGSRNDAQCRYHYLRIMKGEPVNDCTDDAGDAVPADGADGAAARPSAPRLDERPAQRELRPLLPPINLLIGIGL